MAAAFVEIWEGEQAGAYAPTAEFTSFVPLESRVHRAHHAQLASVDLSKFSQRALSGKNNKPITECNQRAAAP